MALVQERVRGGPRPRVLVLHSLYRASRKTIRHHLSCFARYVPEVEVHYHHYRAPITKELRQAAFDLIVLNACVLSNRVTKAFRDILREYAFLPEKGCPIVAIPFDDWMATAHLDEWLYRWDVKTVYTPRDHGQDEIYFHTRRKARLVQVMTGFIDENLLERAGSPHIPTAERAIDIGTRVRNLPYRCGWFGRIKGEQAETMRARAEAVGLVADISTRLEDTFVGNSWFDFLGRCRYTVANRGGSSLLDPYGHIKAKIDRFLKDSPKASFEEVEAACFPGLDSRVPYTAVTPRILDAAVMRTGLVLGEGQYLELEPWVHYLPLEKDFSNAEEIFDAMRDPDRTEQLIEKAWNELVGSGKYTYRAFAQRVVAENLEPQPSAEATGLHDHERLVAGLEEARQLMGPELFELFRRMLQRADRRGSAAELRCALSRSSEQPALEPEAASLALGLRRLSRVERETLRLMYRSGVAHAACRWLDALENGLLQPFGLLPWLSLDPVEEAESTEHRASTGGPTPEFLAALLAEGGWRRDRHEALALYRESAGSAQRLSDVEGWYRAAWLEALLAEELGRREQAMEVLRPLIHHAAGDPALRAKTANIALWVGRRANPEFGLGADRSLGDAFSRDQDVAFSVRATNLRHLSELGWLGRYRARHRASTLFQVAGQVTQADASWLIALAGPGLSRPIREAAAARLLPLLDEACLHDLGAPALLSVLGPHSKSELSKRLRDELTRRFETWMTCKAETPVLDQLLEVARVLGRLDDPRFAAVLARSRRTLLRRDVEEGMLVRIGAQLLALGFGSEAALLVRRSQRQSPEIRHDRGELVLELCRLVARPKPSRAGARQLEELEESARRKLGPDDPLVSSIGTRRTNLEWQLRPAWRKGASAAKAFVRTSRSAVDPL